VLKAAACTVSIKDVINNYDAISRAAHLHQALTRIERIREFFPSLTKHFLVCGVLEWSVEGWWARCIAESGGHGLKSECETRYAPDLSYAADRPWDKAEKKKRVKAREKDESNEASNYQGVLARCDLSPLSLSLFLSLSLSLSLFLPGVQSPRSTFFLSWDTL